MSGQRARTVIVLVGCLTWLSFVGAQEMPVPPQVQGAILSKAFRFDQSLADPNQLRVLLIYDGDPPKFLEDLRSSFTASGISSVPVSVADLPRELDGAEIAYISPSVDIDALAGIFAESKVLTVTGVPGLVEQGRVSVGIGTRSDRPKILVHLERSRIEGHRFSAELLKLSEVFR